MAAEFSGAMPRLYGAPSYTRPPRPGVEPQRPYDPDDLPLESYRAMPAVQVEDDQGTDFGRDGLDDWLSRATRSPFGFIRR